MTGPMRAFLSTSFLLLISPAFAVDPAALGAHCTRQYADTSVDDVIACIQRGMASAAADAPAQRSEYLPPLSPHLDSQDEEEAEPKPIAATPKPVDPTKGCPFLEITQYGLHHAPQTRLCKGDQTLTCSIDGKQNQTGKLTYKWFTTAATSCIHGYQQAKLLEWNRTVFHRANGE